MTNRGFYTYACDVWSLGILLYRMLFAQEPWSSYEEAADAEALPLPEGMTNVSQEALELLRAMLKHDHSQRATVKEVCQFSVASIGSLPTMCFCLISLLAIDSHVSTCASIEQISLGT